MSSHNNTNLAWRSANSRTVDRCSGGTDGRAGAGHDGKTAGGLWECSTALTNVQTAPWWELDLGEDHDIDQIRIWNMLGHRLQHR